MTRKREAMTPMTPERIAFRAEVMALVQDLGLLCRYVVDRPEIPVPTVDVFSSWTFWVLARSRPEFDRLADVLARDGIVEHESHEKFRIVRRRFGRAALEVSLSHDGGPEPTAEPVSKEAS